MQPAGGMVQVPPMAPLPMDHQQQQPPQQYQQLPPAPQWGMVPPPAAQYHQAQAVPPPPMWNQQHSQIPPPVPQSYAPPQAQYGAPAPAPAPAQPASADEIRTLWIGDLQYWMDEGYLNSIFLQTGHLVNAKVIRNRQTGQSEGYGFLEFSSRAAAEVILQSYSGQIMPQTELAFRLNWATYSAGERRADDGSDFTIFVGDLAADVADFVLQETFKSRYPSVKGAKVVTDRLTGRSKGYGFVRFADANEQTRAMSEMNGMLCSTRPMRIGPATNKKTLGAQQQTPAKASYQTLQGTQSDNDPNNTTIFVGGVDPSVTDDGLRQLFSPYGDLVSVKIPVGKRCAFVQFASRASAEEALVAVHGSQLSGQNIRLSWGRSPSNKQTQQDPNQWNGGYYYGQSYDAYGYAQPALDPNMYTCGTYPAYANYQQQQ